jgi:molybdate transport system ATP-binding protein
MLEVSVSKQRAGFSLSAEFAAPTPGVIALFGRSGSGKTTLVNLVSGLLLPDSGHIRLDDTVLTDTAAQVAVPVERRRIGYVFQEPRLFPHLTVAGNLRYGERRARVSARVIDFEEVVALLGLGSLLERRPRQLSGGERQRVALARALLSQPRLLLLDEPLAGVSPSLRETITEHLIRLRDGGLTMLMVEHELAAVDRCCDPVIVMAAGRVLAEGTMREMRANKEVVDAYLLG